MFSIKRLREIISMIPKEAKPRIGGSCALYFYGKVDTYRDVDIIVDSIDGIDLPFPKIEFIHKNRLNKGIKYCIDGQEVDVLERLSHVTCICNATVLNLPFENIRDILCTKAKINKFISENENLCNK